MENKETKKKPGRKPKVKTEQVEKIPKKRGRKPKGGKIVSETNTKIKNVKTQVVKPNIILHLRCNTNNLNTYKSSVSGNSQNISNINPSLINETLNTTLTIENDNNKISNKSKNIESIINKKLKILNNSVHQNNISNKNSDCFWCTYSFTNPPCFIPEKKIKKNIYIYGCFCSPECAAAYLFNQQIDSSTKWERYSLLNSLYASVYNYTKNIKLAPNPHYLLDKFYGNLTIEEYRSTFSQNKLLMLINKPLTQVVPEIFEDNNEFNNKIVDNTTKIKTKSIFV